MNCCRYQQFAGDCGETGRVETAAHRNRHTISSQTIRNRTRKAVREKRSTYDSLSRKRTSRPESMASSNDESVIALFVTVRV